MDFDEAESRFRELQARVQRGEPISRAEYEDQVAQLAVQDDRGVLWEINPRTGKWMYFDGAEWVAGTPPGRDQSTVMPIPRAPTAPPPSSSPPVVGRAPAPPPPLPVAPMRQAPPTPRAPISRSGASGGTPPPPSSRPPEMSAEPIPPYVRVNPEQPSAAPPSGTGGMPAGAPMAPRILRPASGGPLGGANREWVPLAIGAIVLLACALLLWVFGRYALSAMATQTTPTPRASSLIIPTSTPIPTAVQLPTSQTATAVAPATVQAKVIEPSVNVRANPSTSAKVITKVKKDAILTLLGRDEKGEWYQINAPGTTNRAWVFAQTVEVTAGDPASLPVASAAGPTPKPKATSQP